MIVKGSLTYSSSRLGKNHGRHPNTCHSFHYIRKLETDSRLDSKNLDSPPASSGFTCQRTVKRDNSTSKQLVCHQHWLTSPCHTTLRSPTHGTAKTHLTRPRLSFHINTQTRSLVLCRTRISSVSPHPRKTSQLCFFFHSHAPLSS